MPKRNLFAGELAHLHGGGAMPDFALNIFLLPTMSVNLSQAFSVVAS